MDLLTDAWKKESLKLRQKWLTIIDNDGASWDVDLMQTLRDAGMSLDLLSNMYKIYAVEQRIKNNKSVFVTPTAQTNLSVVRKPPVVLKKKSKMIYHLFKAPVVDMTKEEKFDHVVTVRNRTYYGPVKGVQVSSYLDVEISDDNRRFLRLKPEDEDVNMHVSRITGVWSDVFVLLFIDIY